VSDDIRDQSERLRAMLVQSENATRRTQVLNALSSSHEGIQSCALQVLGVWGSPAAVKALREFLIAAYDRKHGWSIRGVAVKSLRPWIETGDAKWILDLYFRVRGLATKHELVPLVEKLPQDAARATLVKHLRDPDAENRQAAAKAIGRLAFADRDALLRPLYDDPDQFVRHAVRLVVRSP
jgi:HEAT repeat protein